ncbi:hypothetical protein SNOG_10580 [Parastagonospora nodorum SN15]|uniref:Uncharacterized protein n=1 Tax=Phaeosphaeria nodorum (strain SN15 / ATCC MYA-4574 / FGSC 10173) TaxID=321614 RepID=Q0UCD4_PHANO|nr:hypothetical protein SNOG_10580 [Parastagonospora nodorum SN15]EAT81974.2 hypothetical protein SNOG_10580 [Parastagonospora nodorum SN15]
MCILTWLSATDGMRNRACPNCRICLFDPSNPGPYIAPDPRPGLELEPPRIMGPRETYIQEQRQRVAERRAAELQHVPAPRLNAIVRELGSPISQREYELQTRQVVEEREAAEQLLAAPNNTVPDQPNPDINAAYDQERLEAEAAEIPASVAQPESISNLLVNGLSVVFEQAVALTIQSLHLAILLDPFVDEPPVVVEQTALTLQLSRLATILATMF